MPGRCFLFTLATDPEDIASLLSTPIVFRDQIGNRLLRFDPRRDGKIAGDVKSLVTRVGEHAIPLV